MVGTHWFAFGLHRQASTQAATTFVVPSDTEIAIPDHIRACSANGVPVSCPVVAEKEAHAGRFTIENISWLPSASLRRGPETVGLADGHRRDRCAGDLGSSGFRRHSDSRECDRQHRDCAHPARATQGKLIHSIPQ